MDGGMVYHSDRSLGKAACNFTTGLYNPLREEGNFDFMNLVFVILT